MARPATRPSALLFGTLALYILLQSVWWMWLLLSKDRDVVALQQQLDAAGVVPRLPVRLPEHSLLMVVGEGSVFIILIVLGLWITYRAMRHDLALARRQRDFLLAASHELRTPIAALKLHLQTLGRPDLGAERRAVLDASLRHDVDRLHALTEKLLMASRLDEAHKPTVRAVRDVAGDVAQLVKQAQASFGAGHRIITDLPPSTALATDAATFGSVVENLLENACKYSPGGSEVHVRLTADKDAVRLSVTDAGPGIPPAERERIFERFYRAGNEETRATKGTGLGLFIVQRAMDALHGRIEVSPAAPHGSTFTATFPLHP